MKNYAEHVADVEQAMDVVAAESPELKALLSVADTRNQMLIRQAFKCGFVTGVLWQASALLKA